MIDRVRAIASATFREAVRDRLLVLVVLFAVGLILFSAVLGWLSVEDQTKMVVDFSLTGLRFLGLFLAMLVGAASLAREVERRTVYTVLTRTTTRTEFIVGKFLGLVAVFWLCIVGCAAILAVWVSVFGGSVGAPFAAAVAGLLLESLLLTAVALFLGALAAPTIASVGTFAFWVIAHGTEAMRDLTEMGRSPDFAGVYAALYRFLPNLEDVNFINATTAGRPVDWSQLALGTCYIALWTTGFLAAAVALFRRRQF